jgi:hypothetical protein
MMNYRSGNTTKQFDEELFGHNAAFIKARFYWLDLKQYFDVFARNQIKVILFDDLKSDAMSVARDLYRFLEVDDAFSPDLKVQNEGGLPRNRALYRILSTGKRLLKRSGLVPEASKKLLKPIERKSLQKTQMDQQIRRKILEVCLDDIQRTQELIGRDLSAWLRG